MIYLENDHFAALAALEWAIEGCELLRLHPVVQDTRIDHNWEMLDILKSLRDSIKVQIDKQYNPLFGDETVCSCGHTYYRHFDTYDDMEPVGCKYCPCSQFK